MHNKGDLSFAYGGLFATLADMLTLWPVGLEMCPVLWSLEIPISFSLMKKAQRVADNSAAIYKGCFLQFSCRNACRNNGHNGTVLNPVCCRHTVDPQRCPWACPCPQPGTLGACPEGEATVLLTQRSAGIPTNMPNGAWQCILRPSMWLQSGFSLSKEQVTNP